MPNSAMNIEAGNVGAMSEHPSQSLGGEGLDNTQRMDDDNVKSGPPKTRRGPRKGKRIILSCVECRRRKLGCDRQQPCQRCFESGTPQLCQYDIRSRPLTANETAALTSQVNGSGVLSLTSPVTTGVTRDASADAADAAPGRNSASLRLQALEEQNAELRQLLLSNENHSFSALITPPAPQDKVPDIQQPQGPKRPSRSAKLQGDKLRRFVVSDDRARSVAPHGARTAFEDLLRRTPSVSISSRDWLSQLADHSPNKDHIQHKQQSEELLSQPALSLEILLPCQQATDEMVTWYLDECEPLHRIVHRPTFLKQYASFWDSQAPRQGVFTVMVLAMSSIAHCLGRESGQLSRATADIPCSTRLGWVAACQEWLEQHGDKFYRLTHIQAACLMQLARRVSRFRLADSWLQASRITRGSISVGLHRDSTSQASCLLQGELMRRVWGTVALIDVHACLNQGLPTLLTHLHIDAPMPRNMEDDEVDVHSSTTNLASVAPEEQYTATSFLIQSLKTLPLRLDLLCHLAAVQRGRADHGQALHFTDQITKVIDDLPSWGSPSQGPCRNTDRKLRECRLLLEIELRQYMMPLHQPFLDSNRNDTRAQFSRFLYYKAIKDLINLQEEVLSLGGAVAGAMHDDGLRFGLGLTRLALLDHGQTRSSVSCPEEILGLMKKCLRFEEIRSLQCGSLEGSHYAVLCAMVAFFESYFGTKTAAAAKKGYRDSWVTFKSRIAGHNDGLGSHESSSAPTTGHARQTRQSHRSVFPSAGALPPLSPLRSAPSDTYYEEARPGGIHEVGINPFSDFPMNWDTGSNNAPFYQDMDSAASTNPHIEGFVDLNSFMLDLGVDLNGI